MAKFRTRARTLDMLGRQQIAGIPTAINELFKNAHDAYADHVEADFFRYDNLLLLRDDGIGMTKKEFLDRWLVIGTESKVEDGRSNTLPIPEGKEKRVLLGEKGIGRLSIAAIGRLVLVVSRAKRDGKLCNTVAALIHWGLFEIPGLNLDDVSIPVRSLAKVPTDVDVEEMKTELIDSIGTFIDNDYLLKSEADGILKDLHAFSVNPIKLQEKCPTNLSLERAEGTHFIIASVSPSIKDSIDISSNQKDTPSGLEKILISFTNTMTPNHPPPKIKVAFRDHFGDEHYNPLIDPEAFFTPEDFENADHHFVGKFDEFGQWTGNVVIYNKHTIHHTIPWAENQYKKTLCGPFSIECSYLQGNLSQTSVDPVRFAVLKRKSDRFGGLYIYKDGIRILPYGDRDYDFLDIEKNRTKSASYYFFSYRRIFGVVNITKDDNAKLTEKAGREGFIENRAYKQIQDILKNFFLQLVTDFFRESDKGGSGVLTEYWETIRNEQEKIHEAQKRRNQQATVKKRNFTISLNAFFASIQSGKLYGRIDAVLTELEKDLYTIDMSKDVDVVVNESLEVETLSRQRLEDIRNDILVKTPRGFVPTREQRENWSAYLEQNDLLEANHLKPSEKRITEIVTEYHKKFNISVSNRQRVQKAVEQVADNAKIITRKKHRDARNVAREMGNRVRTLTQDLMYRVEESVKNAQSALTSLPTTDIDDEILQNEISRLERPILQERDYATKILESIIGQIEGIYWEKDESGNIVTNRDLADSLEEEVSELRSKVESDAELIQLGLAVNIVHHEFANAVKALRSDIRLLKRKAEFDETLQVAYKNIKANFGHLDHYLSLLTPFNRRLYREQEEIKAEDIYIFMQDVFRGRMQRHSINLKRTRSFVNTTFMGYRSVFYPVFANLVDNAIHWLKQNSNDTERIIRLHADKQGSFFISNSGPEIPMQDWERIFELGFSKKPNGRGMGLTISRDVLKGVDYSIVVDSPRNNSNVTFKITPKENNPEGMNE